MTDSQIPPAFAADPTFTAPSMAPPPPPKAKAEAYIPPKSASWMEVPMVTHEINGHTVRFRAVGVGVFMKLRPAFTTLVKSMVALRRTARSETGFRQEDKEDGNTVYYEDGTIKSRPGVSRSSMQLSADPELVQVIEKERREGLEQIMDVLLGQTYANEIHALICASVVDDRLTPSDILGMPAPVYVEMLLGVAKANEGIFGPLGPALRQEMTQGMEALKKQQMNPGDTSGAQWPTSSAEGTL